MAAPETFLCPSVAQCPLLDLPTIYIVIVLRDSGAIRAAR